MQNVLNWNKTNIAKFICLFLPVNSLLLQKMSSSVALIFNIYIPILK